MRKWPQTLSTSPFPHLFYMGWHHRLALSYQYSIFHLSFTSFLSHIHLICFKSPWTLICDCVCVCVCVWLFMAPVWGMGGERGSEYGKEQERPDDLIFSEALKAIYCHLCEYLGSTWVHVMTLDTFLFNLFSILELRVCLCVWQQDTWLSEWEHQQDSPCIHKNTDKDELLSLWERKMGERGAE